MEDSSTTHLHTITLSPALSGLQMGITLPLALLRCSDFVTDLDGPIHSTNQTVDLSSTFLGVTMAQLSLELVESRLVQVEALALSTSQPHPSSRKWDLEQVLACSCIAEVLQVTKS